MAERGNDVDPAEVTKGYAQMYRELKLPWMQRANKRRIYTPPHWNSLFIKLIARKKLLYDRKEWNPNRVNKTAYEQICKEAQRTDRQLIMKQNRHTLKRIKAEPGSHIAIDLRKQGNTRKRHVDLDRLTGKQMAPRTFAAHMNDMLDREEYIEVTIENLYVNIAHKSKRIEREHL